MLSSIRYGQTRRIMAVLRILCRSRSPLTIAQITERLPEYGIESDDRGTDPRNIERDIAFLRGEMHYPIETIRGEGYLLHGRHEVLPILFTREQLEALCMTRELFTAFSGTHLGCAIDDMYQTISAIYHSGALHASPPLDRLSEVFSIRCGPVRRHDRKREVIRALIEAIISRRKTEMCYLCDTAPTGAWITVLPHQLIIHRESFYLLALSEQDEKPRFKRYLTDRVLDVQLTSEDFHRIDLTEEKNLMEKSFGIYTAGKPARVQIHFDRRLATYLQERVWHASQRLTVMEKGVLLEMNVLINTELEHWVRGFGSMVTHIEPETLRNSVRETIGGDHAAAGS